jgi:hypothetical protein
MRLDSVAGDFLMENPRTDDPRGIRLAARISRIQRWMGKRLWDMTTMWTMRPHDETVTESSGCVFCDLELKPTRCTDGWFHLFDDGRTIPCPIRKE